MCCYVVFGAGTVQATMVSCLGMSPLSASSCAWFYRIFQFYFYSTSHGVLAGVTRVMCCAREALRELCALCSKRMSTRKSRTTCMCLSSLTATVGVCFQVLFVEKSPLVLPLDNMFLMLPADCRSSFNGIRFGCYAYQCCPMHDKTHT